MIGSGFQEPEPETQFEKTYIYHISVPVNLEPNF